MSNESTNKLEQAIREIRDGQITKYGSFPLFLAMTELDNPIAPGTMLDYTPIEINPN